MQQLANTLKVSLTVANISRIRRMLLTLYWWQEFIANRIMTHSINEMFIQGSSLKIGLFYQFYHL